MIEGLTSRVRCHAQIQARHQYRHERPPHRHARPLRNANINRKASHPDRRRQDPRVQAVGRKSKKFKITKITSQKRKQLAERRRFTSRTMCLRLGGHPFQIPPLRPARAVLPPTLECVVLGLAALVFSWECSPPGGGQRRLGVVVRPSRPLSAV